MPSSRSSAGLSQSFNFLTISAALPRVPVVDWAVPHRVWCGMHAVVSGEYCVGSGKLLTESGQSSIL